MGKEYDFLKAVREQDIYTLGKILAKSKSKITGSIKKFNINYQDKDGLAAIHHAALLGNSDIMKLLIENGSNVRLKDGKGMHPLHYASWRGFAPLVHMLLQHGAAASEPGHNENTPLHLAAEHGHTDVVMLLLEHHGDPMRTNHQHKTPLHLATEFGRYKVVEVLIHSNKVGSLLGPMHTVHDPPSTCLHLAARNGHEHTVRLLLQAGMDVNQETIKGTCLHEAALHGKIDVVKLLIAFGVDVNRPNSNDQTALDIVEKFTTMKGSVELKQLLKSASDRDSGISPQHQQHRSVRPLSAYQSLHATHGDVAAVQQRLASPADRTAEWVGNLLPPAPAPPAPSSTGTSEASPSHSNRNSMASSGGSSSTGPADSPHYVGHQSSPHHSQMSVSHPAHGPHAQLLYPGAVHHRLSGHSYESGGGSSSNGLQSYHSNSSSSMGSLDRLENSAKYPRPFNADELLCQGYPDGSVLRLWLEQLGMEEYVGLFIAAEYDMPTVARMTPDDLIAIGIQKPSHRKRLKFELNRMIIRNPIPEHPRGTVEEWLQQLTLHQYYSHLWHQGYQTIDSLKGLTWEDLEEIGITKLGHQKKIMLAVTQLKRSTASAPPVQQQVPVEPYPGWRGPPANSGPPPYSLHHQRSASSGQYNSASNTDLMSTSYEDEEDAAANKIHGSSEILNLRQMVSPLKKEVARPDVVAIQVSRMSSIGGGEGGVEGERGEDGSSKLTYDTFREQPQQQGSKKAEFLPPPYETVEPIGNSHGVMIPVEMLKRRESTNSDPDKPFSSYNSGTLPRHRPRINQHNRGDYSMGGDLEISSQNSNSAPVSPANANANEKVIGKRPPPPPKRTNSIKGISVPPVVPPKPLTPQMSHHGRVNGDVEKNDDDEEVPVEEILTADEMDYPPPPPPLTSTEKTGYLVSGSIASNGGPKHFPPPPLGVGASSEPHRPPVPVFPKPSVLTSKPQTPPAAPPKPRFPTSSASPAAVTISTPQQSPVKLNPVNLSPNHNMKSPYVNVNGGSPNHHPKTPPAKPSLSPKRTQHSNHSPTHQPYISSSNTPTSSSSVSNNTSSTPPNPPPKPPLRDTKIDNPPSSSSSPPRSVEKEKGHLNDVIQQMEKALKKPVTYSPSPVPPPIPPAPVESESSNDPPLPPPPPSLHPASSDESDSDTDVASQGSTPSQGSVDFSTLPFANENVGTIKQRSAANNKPSIMDVNIGGDGAYNGATGGDEEDEDDDDDDNYVDFVETGTMKRNPHVNKAASVPNNSDSKFHMPAPVKLPEDDNMEFSGENSAEVLNDIDSMLQGLTDELDALLEHDI